jgi:hypothetical protein
MISTCGWNDIDVWEKGGVVAVDEEHCIDLIRNLTYRQYWEKIHVFQGSLLSAKRKEAKATKITKVLRACLPLARWCEPTETNVELKRCSDRQQELLFGSSGFRVSASRRSGVREDDDDHGESETKLGLSLILMHGVHSGELVSSVIMRNAQVLRCLVVFIGTISTPYYRTIWLDLEWWRSVPDVPRPAGETWYHILQKKKTRVFAFSNADFKIKIKSDADPAD